MIKAKDLSKLTQSEVREQNIKTEDIIFKDNNEDNLIRAAWLFGWRGIGQYCEGSKDTNRHDYNKYLNDK